MEKLTEFPALEDRKAYLERALYEATRQNDDAAFEGKHDTGGEQWLVRIRAELKELRYALSILGSQGNRIDVQGHTFLIAVTILVLVMLAQIVVLATVGH